MQALLRMPAHLDAFLATMVTPSQPIPTGSILALMRQHYGFEPRVTRLTGERDENFRLTADDGAEYVLKIANPAESPAETDLQTAALLHIEKTDPTLPCPRVLRDRTGDVIIRGRIRNQRILAGRSVQTDRRNGLKHLPGRRAVEG